MEIRTIGDLKKVIKDLPNTAIFLTSSDEELNTLFSVSEIAKIGNNEFCIYGFSGTEK